MMSWKIELLRTVSAISGFATSLHLLSSLLTFTFFISYDGTRHIQPGRCQKPNHSSSKSHSHGGWSAAGWIRSQCTGFEIACPSGTGCGVRTRQYNFRPDRLSSPIVLERHSHSIPWAYDGATMSRVPQRDTGPSSVSGMSQGSRAFRRSMRQLQMAWPCQSLLRTREWDGWRRHYRRSSPLGTTGAWWGWSG